MKIVKEIELKFAQLSLYDPPLVKVEMHGNVLITETESREINNKIGELSGGKEIPVLMVAEELTQFDSTARTFSASEEGMRYTLGDAFVVRNIAQRLIASFYLSFNKPKKPSKIFDSEEAAMKWLYSLSK